MCYRFTTPLRRRPAHGFVSAQARKMNARPPLRGGSPRAMMLDALAGSSFSAATRGAGLAPEGAGSFARPSGKTDGIGMFPNPVVSGVGKGTRTLDTRNHNPVL